MFCEESSSLPLDQSWLQGLRETINVLTALALEGEGLALRQGHPAAPAVGTSDLWWLQRGVLALGAPKPNLSVPGLVLAARALGALSRSASIPFQNPLAS